MHLFFNNFRMGSVISLEEGDIKTNELLKRLAEKEPISDNDPYWNKLFSFNFNIQQLSRFFNFFKF